MITINLLPVKEKKRRQQVLIIVYVVLGLLLITFVLGWLLSTRYRVRAELREEIARIDEESAGYQEKIKEIKEFEASQAKLNGFRGVAQAIGNDQRKLLGSLDLIASQLPDEVWLHELTQGRDKDENTLIIRGYAFSQSVLETFNQNLGRPSAFLADPSLSIVNPAALRGQNRTYQFEIKTSMVAPK